MLNSGPILPQTKWYIGCERIFFKKKDFASSQLQSEKLVFSSLVYSGCATNIAHNVESLGVRADLQIVRYNNKSAHICTDSKSSQMTANTQMVWSP